MACIPLFAPLVAMATTQLARVIHCEGVSTPQLVSNVERNSVRMSWVVVTDSAGDRHLQMQWASSEANLRRRCSRVSRS
jgi:hypothetical protein